jgi:hypothetical protein
VSTEIPATSRPSPRDRAAAEFLPFRLGAVAVGVDHLEDRTPAGWTLKAMLAHVAAWHESATRRLRSLRETGQPLDPLDERDADAFNARVVAAVSRTPQGEVLDRLVRSFDELREELERVDDAALQAHNGWGLAVLAGETFDHYPEHHAELMAAVPRTRVALLERVDAGWRRFRPAVGAADLRRVTSAGWSGKGLVGHLTHWLDTIPVEVDRRMRAERGPLPNVDAENARFSGAAEPLDADVVVSRFEDAFAAAREAIPAEGELPFPVVSYVAVQTYEHLRGHGPELAEIRR